MKPGTWELVIQQGKTWRPIIRWHTGTIDGPVVNLTDYSARLQVRHFPASEDVLLDLSTDNGKITIDGPAGEFRPLLTSVQTAALAFRRGVFDMEITDPDGAVDALLEGPVRVIPEVTR